MKDLHKVTAILVIAIAAIAIYWVLAREVSVSGPEPERNPVEQPTFRKSVFENIRPGGFVIEATDFGPIYIIKPNIEIWDGLERIVPRTKNSTYETYNPDLDLFVVWGVYEFCFMQIFPKYYDESLEPWEGGFYDSCRDLYFDFSGRVLDLPPNRAEPNLRAPKYEPAGSDHYRLLEPDPIKRFRQ